MQINLNFADVVENDFSPVPPGFYVARIVGSDYMEPKSADKSPALKITYLITSEGVGNGRKIMVWYTLVQKNYPKLLMKKMSEAAFGVEMNDNIAISPADYIDRSVVLQLDIDHGVEVAVKKDGVPTGEKTKRDFNKVVGIEAYKPTTSLQ